jgi:hypothetical protein
MRHKQPRTARAALPKETKDTVPHSVRDYNDIVKSYRLTLLEQSADWSIENGDLALTADGDIRNGSVSYSALSRLVQLWCFNETHFRYLFASANGMIDLLSTLGDDLDRIANQRTANITSDPFEGFDQFAEALHLHSDKEGMVFFGANTFAGSLLIALGNALQRFRADVEDRSGWDTAWPTFGRYSLGNVMIAAANGYRHENEWSNQLASKGKLTGQQKASHDVIVGALAGQSISEISGPARIPEILRLLSNGEFERLTANIFEFSNNVATKAAASRR